MKNSETEKQIRQLINQGKAKPLAWVDLRMAVVALVMLNIIEIAFRIAG